MLRVGVSLAAIALAAPALAADMVVSAPVPTADQGEFRAFVEGGAFWTAGNAIPYTAPGLEIFGATSILPLGGGGTGATNVSLRPRWAGMLQSASTIASRAPPGTSICKRAGVRREEAPP